MNPGLESSPAWPQFPSPELRPLSRETFRETSFKVKAPRANVITVLEHSRTLIGRLLPAGHNSVCRISFNSPNHPPQPYLELSQFKHEEPEDERLNPPEGPQLLSQSWGDTARSAT